MVVLVEVDSEVVLEEVLVVVDLEDLEEEVQAVVEQVEVGKNSFMLNFTFILHLIEN